MRSSARTTPASLPPDRAAHLMELLGLSDKAMIEKGDHRIEGGAMAMRSLLKLPQRPTAVIASNDLTAIGALGAIHEAGLKVPEDFSLIGFDDISFAHLTQPPLTTVILSRTQLAVTAYAAELHADALKAGCVECLAKPVDTDQLDKLLGILL